MTAMPTIPFDRLRYTDMLRNAGIDEKAARAHADALDDVMRQGVATKSDVTDLHSALKSNIADARTELKSDIADVRTALKSDIAGLQTELKSDIADVRREIHDIRHELKTDIAGLRFDFKLDMSSLELAVSRLIVEKHVAMLQWLAGGLTGLFVGIIAAIKLFK
jgi:gas vesicle protein